MSSDYIRECIRTWVWSGYHDEADARKLVRDILEGDVDIAAIHAAIAAEFERKHKAEESWPEVTDCDRLDRAFVQLDGEGICAAQYAGQEVADGHSAIAMALDARGAEKYHGYCFFTGWNVENAMAGQGLWISYGDLSDDEAKALAVGRRVFAVLQTSGLQPQWDGTVDKRIGLPTIDWKRRY